MSPASSASSSSICIKKTKNFLFTQNQTKNKNDCINNETINFYSGNDSLNYNTNYKNYSTKKLINKKLCQSTNYLTNSINYETAATFYSESKAPKIETQLKYQKLPNQLCYGRWTRSGSGKWRQINNNHELSRSTSVDRFSLKTNKSKLKFFFLKNRILILKLIKIKIKNKQVLDSLHPKSTLKTNISDLPVTKQSINNYNQNFNTLCINDKANWFRQNSDNSITLSLKTQQQQELNKFFNFNKNNKFNKRINEPKSLHNVNQLIKQVCYIFCFVKII